MEVNYPSPILRWAGGKRWLTRYLSTLVVTKNRRLVDPFTGGMSVPLGLSATDALLCDANPHLMNFYLHLKQGFRKSSEFDNIEFKNRADVYYTNRALFNTLCDTRQFWTTEGALLFYYLNRTGFNGLCRFNNSGQYNVPFGRHKTINYTTEFYDFLECMKNWELLVGDFANVPLKDGDFIYADPPYDVEFTKFSEFDFTWEDQTRLVEWLKQHKGPAIASNQATPRIIELYKNNGFDVYSLPGPRSISATGDRTPATEILAIKQGY